MVCRLSSLRVSLRVDLAPCQLGVWVVLCSSCLVSWVALGLNCQAELDLRREGVRVGVDLGCLGVWVGMWVGVDLGCLGAWVGFGMDRFLAY